jgi:hypothetical protein
MLPEQPPPQELQLLAAVALMPRDAEHAHEPAVRWPTYLVIGLAVVIVLLFALWRWVLVPATAVLEPTRTVNSATLPTLDARMPAATLLPAIPTELLAPTAIPVIPATPVPPSATPVPTIGPTATPRPSMPLGEVIQESQWTLTLLRPEDALLLDGSIGSLQPHGRFALALLAVGNMGDLPSRIPDGLIALQDEQGNRYAPLPTASTTYLATYGRGQAGDVSYDEPIPTDAGNLSVPIIFDVPPGTRGLQLVVGKAPMGWSVSGS